MIFCTPAYMKFLQQPKHKAKTFNNMKFLSKAIIMAAMSTAAVQASAAGYEIKAHLKGAKYEGKMVKLGISKSLLDYQYLDSALIKDGTVTFTGKLNGEKLLSLRIFPDDTRDITNENGAVQRPELRVFMGDEKVEITAEIDSLQSDWDLYSAPMNYKNIEIKGSKQALDFVEFQKVLAVKNDAYDKASEPYYEFWGRREQSALKEGVETYKVSQAAKLDIYKCQYEFAKAHITEPIGLYALGKYASHFSLSEIQALEAAVPAKLKATATGKEIIKELQETKKSVPGAMFYDTELMTPDGKKFKISDYCGKGKYVLLEFWASWCGPCRQDIPHIKDAYAHYHPQGFEIISISMDTNEKAWKAAVEREQMDWVQGTDLKAFNGTLSKVYNFNGIPFCILIGPDGKIVERNWRASAMDAGLIDIYGNHWGERYTETNTRFHIAGNITDGQEHGHDAYTASDGKNVYLYYMNGQEEKVDSAKIADGSFVFTGELGTQVQQVAVAMKPMNQVRSYNDMARFYLEPGNSNLIIDVNNFSKIRTYGSKVQAEKDRFEAANKEIFDEMDKLNEEYERTHDESLREKMIEVRQKIRKLQVEYAKANPKSYLVPEMIYVDAESMPFEDLEYICQNMTDLAKSSQMGKIVLDTYEGLKNNRPGCEAFAFSSKDVQTGKTVDLKQFRGKYVLVDFWATWCVPCRKSNPHVLEIYNKYHKKGLEVVFVADDDNNVPKLKEAIKKDGLQKMHHILRGLKMISRGNYDRTNDISDKYGVHSIPTKYLIDPEGKIVGKMDNDELDAKLKEIYGM